jgi:dihydroxyacetone kinase-like protein
MGAVLKRDDVLAWLRAFAAAIEARRDELTALDAAIGDADHGANLDRGMRAAMAKLPGVADRDIGTVLKTVGMTLVSTVGGASGPLYGTLFLQMGTATGGKSELSPAEWVGAWRAGIDGLVARGKAVPGDKTMVDALIPALDALRAAESEGVGIGEATHRAADAARRGAEATVPLVARKGRASYLGERSADHLDPGAASAALLVQAAAEAAGLTPPP